MVLSDTSTRKALVLGLTVMSHKESVGWGAVVLVVLLFLAWVVVIYYALIASTKRPQYMFPGAPGLHILFAVFPPTVIPEVIVLLVEFRVAAE